MNKQVVRVAAEEI